MRIFFVILAVLSALLIPTAASAAPYCGIDWGSLPKTAPAMGTGEIDTVRTGQHDCYDRIVVDIDGPPAGYDVRYVSQVTADGSGAVVTTPGGAKLQFIARHPRYTGTVGQSVANVSGYRTLRSVVYAGSFEGQTTYGVGVRARLPFRVFTIPGGHGRIVLDVAHQW
jgi:hypothetical protein